MEKERELLRDDFTHDLTLNDIKKCPKCSSVFLTEEICETCGVIFEKLDKDIRKGNDFYDIKESFEGELKGVFRPFPEVAKKYSEDAIYYKRDLKKRLRELLNFFDCPKRHSSGEETYFLYELKDLILEFKKFDPKNEFGERLISEYNHPTYIGTILPILRAEWGRGKKFSTPKIGKFQGLLLFIAWAIVVNFIAYYSFPYFLNR